MASNGGPVTKVISFITGMIDLVATPPNGFRPQPTVEVNEAPAMVEKLQEGRWKYLAIVGEGTYTIVVKMGQVAVSKTISIHQGQTVESDFVFSSTEGTQFR